MILAVCGWASLPITYCITDGHNDKEKAIPQKE